MRHVKHIDSVWRLCWFVCICSDPTGCLVLESPIWSNSHLGCYCYARENEGRLKKDINSFFIVSNSAQDCFYKAKHLSKQEKWALLKIKFYIFFPFAARLEEHHESKTHLLWTIKDEKLNREWLPQCLETKMTHMVIIRISCRNDMKLYALENLLVHQRQAFTALLLYPIATMGNSPWHGQDGGAKQLSSRHSDKVSISCKPPVLIHYFRLQADAKNLLWINYFVRIYRVDWRYCGWKGRIKFSIHLLSHRSNSSRMKT